MKYFVLTLFLILCAPCATVAGPPSHGAVLLARANGGEHRPAPGTVVITGRDGKVTGVEKRHGERRREDEGERGRERDRNHVAPAPAPGNRPD